MINIGELIDGVLKNNRRKCDEFYNICLPYAKEAAGYYTSDTDLKSDYVMISMERVFKYIKTFKKKDSLDSLKSWVKHVANNAILTYILSEKKHRVVGRYDDAAYNIEGVTGILNEAECFTSIERSNINCSDIEKETFNLYYINGMSEHEISKQLGITKQLVRTRLKRCRDKIFKNINEKEICI